MTLKRVLKKTGLKEYTVHFGTFDFSLNCVVGPYSEISEYLAYKWDKDKKWVSELNEEFDKDYTPRGRFYRHGDYCPIIWVPKKPRTPRELATFSHEILHAVYELCRWAGIPLNESTEEVRTHAQAHAFTNLLSQMK